MQRRDTYPQIKMKCMLRTDTEQKARCLQWTLSSFCCCSCKAYLSQVTQLLGAVTNDDKTGYSFTCADEQEISQTGNKKKRKTHLCKSTVNAHPLGRRCYNTARTCWCFTKPQVKYCCHISDLRTGKRTRGEGMKALMAQGQMSQSGV